MALQIAITVPAQADPGEIVDILSTISNPNNNTLTIAWQTTAGDIDDDSAEDTSITVPETPTVIAVTCTITSDANETATATAYLTVGDPKANIYTPAVRIEIEGVDVTDRRIPRDGLVVGKSLDYPELLTFRSSGISFNLDNEDGDFDYNNPSNFFITQGLPAHGRGAKVLVRIGLSQSELIPVFAGEISEVITRLGDTKARIKARDLSVRSRQKVIENFGIEITRRITDFEGAALDYDALNAVFYFPIWGLPISRNSVSLTVHQGGSDISINVVEAIKTEGVLSNRNAEIDYARGLIRFEAPPDNAEATQITATWKRDYRYKRPDFLVRQLLKQTGVQSTLGITDDTDARFAIEQALVRHPTDRIFSSHGRPFFEKAGIVRWMMREADNAKRYMAQDNRLVEYDELQDKYTELAEAPTGGQSISNNFGDRLASETVNLPAGFTTSGQALAITDTRFYITTSLGTDDLYWFDRSGSQLGSFQVLRSGYQVQGLDIYNGFAYIAQNRSSGTKRIDVYNLATETIDTNKSFTVLTGSLLKGISVTAEYIYVLCSTSTADGQIKVYNHSGVEQTSLSFVFTRTQVGSTFGTSHGITTSSTHIIIVEQVTNQVMVRSFFYNGTEDTNRSFSILANVDDPKGLDSVNSRLYVLDADSRQINVYFIGGGEDRPFIPVRFDTHDFEDIYCLCTQSLAGDASQDIVVNPVAVYKYDKSADTWTVVLDADDGEPQLAHPYQGVYEDPFSSDFTPLADNRKNFQVVRRSNKTLIFYRRVESSQSSIAVYNETDDMITNIHTTAHSVGDGLPYSMDFALDIRNGGIYVYSFVVYYSATNSTLRLYRERFSVESQRYTETITRVDDSDGNAQYAVSVSDVILNDADGKWYFVLTWAAEGTGTGKAELCTIAKDGGGSRTVLKTYDDPTLSARSPAEMDGRFFYVEGGWVRREKTSTDDDVPAEEHYYPNEGGTLIEIESNNDITDHGVIWRSAKKADSPETESDVYDGWGLHNAVVSNMIVDDRDNLHVVAGYGLPYDIENNSPLSRTADSIPDETNFNWIQFGQDLATKIASCPTNGRRGWELIQQLAQLMNWEIGFNPAMRKVDAVQAADASISDWSANASFFFRPRTILPAKLRTAITASGSPTTITLNDSGLPAEGSEFPVPPSGERYTVIINKELFTYTGVTADSQGRALTGIQRGQNGSTAAAHSIDAAAYFVDTFASGEQGTTLVSIQKRSQDFVNLKNNVNVGFGDAVYPAKDQTSIDEHGEKAFNLGTSQPLLSRQDQAWAELIGDIYLDELSGLKEVLQFTLVFSPPLQPGQLGVVYQLDRVRIEFKLFRLLQVQHHTHPRFQVAVTALEIIP